MSRDQTFFTLTIGKQRLAIKAPAEVEVVAEPPAPTPQMLGLPEDLPAPVEIPTN